LSGAWYAPAASGRPTWLQQRSGLGELIDDDFAALDLNRLYRVSDRLLAHRATLEAFLYQQACDLFSLTQTTTLYDLTNTFFEGTASANPKAKRGHSKEKRSDCPLVTLALVLDGSGFPKRSEVQRPQRQRTRDTGEDAPAPRADPRGRGPDGGHGCGYCHRGEPRLAPETRLPLSGRQPRTAQAIRPRAGHRDPRRGRHPHPRPARGGRGHRGDTPGLPHSTAREGKERGILERFATRLEAELQHLASGLHRPRRVKDYDKVLTRIGRLRQRDARVARYYDIRLEKDEGSMATMARSTTSARPLARSPTRRPSTTPWASRTCRARPRKP